MKSKKIIKNLLISLITTGVLVTMPVVYSFSSYNQSTEKTKTIKSAIHTSRTTTSFNRTYVLNSNGINTFDVSNISGLPYKDYFFWDQTDANKNNTLVSLFINEWSNYLFVNINPNITNSNIKLSGVTYDAINGVITINNISLLEYINNGEEQTGQLDLGKLVIKGLKRRQTEINITKDTNSMYGTIILENNELIWDSTNWFNKNSIQIFNTYPSEFRKNIENNTTYLNSPIDSYDLSGALLLNVPDYQTKINSKDWWQIINRIDNDEDGSISFQVRFKNINNANGDYSSYWSNYVRIKMIGFKKKISWAPWLKQSDGTYQISVGDNEKIQLISIYSPIYKNELINYLNKNKNKFIINNVSNFTISDLTYELIGNDLLLSNIKLTDNTTLPNIKLTNVIFSSINVTPKTNISSTTNNFPTLLAKQLIESTNIKNVLSNYFDGVSNIDENKFKIVLDEEKIFGNNSLGILQIAFNVVYKENEQVFLSFLNVFSGFKNGETKIINNGTLLDDKFSSMSCLDLYNNLKASNSNIVNFIKEYNCINNLVEGTTITVSTNDVEIDFVSNSIKIKNIIVNKYVEESQIIETTKNLGDLLLVGFKQDANAETIIEYSNNYASNQLFSEILSVNDLIPHLSDQNYLSHLVNVVNPVEGYNLTATVVGEPDNKNGIITLSFTVDKWYDEYKNVNVSRSKEFIYKYQFLKQSSTTSVNSIINLPDKTKYAYEYTSADLESIDNLVNNKVPGSEILVEIQSCNNRTGIVFATIKVNMRYSIDGTIQTPDSGDWFEFINISFIGAKILDKPTTLKTSSNEISLTSKDFILLLNNTLTSNSILKEYINIENGLSDTEIIYVKDSAIEVDGKLGIVQADFKINNYIDDDLYYSYQETVSDRIFTLQFITYIIPETSLNQGVKINGIDTMAYDEVLANNDVKYLIINYQNDNNIQNMFKNFIRKNVSLILNSYSNIELNNQNIDIINLSYVSNSPYSIQVTFGISDCNLGDNTTGSKIFTFVMNNIRVQTNEESTDQSSESSRDTNVSWLIYAIVGVLGGIVLVIIISFILVKRRAKI